MANRVPNCPVEQALGLIGGKWKGIILYHLMTEKKRFGELKKHMPSITQRMLTKQLRELESDGLIHREVFKVVPPKVEYSLTDMAEPVKPIILALKEWGTTLPQASEDR
ncbi:winged helix-turn-helix transcriptional regulator [Desulfoluna spongiiphila]|uniref:winged helix-turn-helix transcriptional regulator n=1 Tax=Desulfoluna spongiiphila TaxID=419481 RepID=UPI001259E227|nr:helix-turn-helix domain-containing protein [Desulfoluna spongiiphila]VVS94272.1 helix-turn-helix hxlr type [Desulfoluna spongiiphila]